MALVPRHVPGVIRRSAPGSGAEIRGVEDDVIGPRQIEPPQVAGKDGDAAF